MLKRMESRHNGATQSFEKVLGTNRRVGLPGFFSGLGKVIGTDEEVLKHADQSIM